jgi:hypothetical protein
MSVGGLIEGRPLDRRSASLETTPRPACQEEGQHRLWRSEGAKGGSSIGYVSFFTRRNSMFPPGPRSFVYEMLIRSG